MWQARLLFADEVANWWGLEPNTTANHEGYLPCNAIRSAKAQSRVEDPAPAAQGR